MAKHEPAALRRTQLLDAALACFAEHGYHLARIDDIANHAGLSKGAFYHHFASKNEIVEAVFRRGIDVMEQAWDDAAATTAGADPFTRLAAHVRAHLAALFDHGPYTAAHVTAFRTAPVEVRDAVVPMRDAYEARWAELLGELAAAGDLAVGTPVGLSRLTLFGAMNTTVEWFDPARGNLDELADVITHQFWNGVAT